MQTQSASATATIDLRQPPASLPSSPLPTLLQTPGGLALLELQGNFNLPQSDGDGDDGPENSNGTPRQRTTPIGRLDFPDYDAAAAGNADGDTSWMHRVHLYVGPHQRLTGEVKKLPRPLAVVRRADGGGSSGSGSGSDSRSSEPDRLEVVEIVHYKLLFSQRPEPMTTAG